MPPRPARAFALRALAHGLAVAALLVAVPAGAQSGGPRLSPLLSAAGPVEERDFLSGAQPMQALVDPASLNGTAGAIRFAAPVADTGPAAISPGSAGRPVRSMVDEAEYRLTTGAAPVSGDGPRAEFNHGVGLEDTPYHFSDSLLFPSPYYAPHRSVGRLVFTASDGRDYWCTATLISRAVIVTAGHCVFDGGANDESGWNRSGYFYPGYSAADGESQRFGRCRILRWGTTDAWYTRGELNGGYDVGVALCDRVEGARWTYVNNWLPGERLGYLGFCYENCRSAYAFLTQLGYPLNYYRGGEMTVGQHLAISGQPIPNATSLTGLDFVFGSGMQGGSSGGPQIANLGELDDATPNPGEAPARNVIYAVTSWGFVGNSFKLQGASPLSGVDNENGFSELFNALCRTSRRVHGTWSCRSVP